MKKLLIVLLALTVLGIFAFADDAPAGPSIVWNASAYNGFAVVSDSNLSTNTVQQYSYDWEGAGAYRFQMAVNAADGNSGFQMRLQTGDQKGAGLAFNEIWAYGKFFNGMVKVEGGLLNDYSIATGGWECYGNTDSGVLGAQIDIMPVDGLTIGLYMPFGGMAIGSGNYYNAIGNSMIGFGYELKDIAHIAAGYILSPTTNGSALYAGAVIKAVPNLSANVELKLSNLGDSNLGVTNIEEYVAYPVGDLTVSAYAGEWMYASASSNFYFNIEPQVAYKVAPGATVALIGNVYTFNGGGSAMTFVSPTDGLASNLKSASVAESPALAFGAGPNVQLTAGGFKVTVGDYYGIVPSTTTIKATDRKSVV